MQITKHINELEIVNEILLNFEEDSRNDIDAILRKIGLTDNIVRDLQILSTVNKSIVSLENILKYIEKFGDSYILTDLGKKVKSAGGHFVYLEKLEEKSIADTERQRLNDEKLKYDVKNAKRIFRTYWWTFGISILGFLLALGKIIYDIIKAK